MRPWFSAPCNALFAARLVLVLSVAGCAGSSSLSATATPSVHSAAVATATASAAASADPWPRIRERVAIDAETHRSLYLLCDGPGPTTVVYLHGMAQTASDGGKEHAALISADLRKDTRICRYDRANVGDSDPVDGKQTAADAVKDLRLLLENAGILAGAKDHRVFLLGASFGGLVAYEYAVRYPDDVAGLVVLDPVLPREYLDIDPYYHPIDGQLTGEEWHDNAEHMDWLGSMQETSALEGQEPKVPLTYFALVHPATWWKPVTPRSVRAYRAMQQRFVNLWSPGRLMMVDTPHYMEPVIPNQIADALREVINLAVTTG